MKNYYLVTILLLLLAAVSEAQQEDHFTQFMHNKLAFNPAYAGSTGSSRLTAMARQQWIGIEGAPEAQLITFNSAPNAKVGIGGSLVRSSIGIMDRYTLEGDYAYRFRLGNGYFGIGVSASIRLIQANLRNLQANQPIEIDNAIPVGFQSRVTPNFGGGFYYNSNDFYVGLSIPRFLKSSIDLSDDQGTIAREDRHWYLMTGFNVRLVDNDIVMQPNFLLKYVDGAPFDADVNLSFTFFEQFTVGASYRTGGNKENSIGESVSGLLSSRIGDKWMAGLSYDFTLSDLQDYNDGSAELFIHHFFGGKSGKGATYDNPRFFNSNGSNKRFY